VDFCPAFEAITARVLRKGGELEDFDNADDVDADNAGEWFEKAAARGYGRAAAILAKWDEHRAWFTFKGVKARRFSLTCSGDQVPSVFEEIVF
jgi:TPR repeat protein